MPATATITLQTDLFKLPPLPLCSPVVTENGRFQQFIILSMMLLVTHDSAIRWEEILGVP
jgi:hypothetical protein